MAVIIHKKESILEPVRIINLVMIILKTMSQLKVETLGILHNRVMNILPLTVVKYQNMWLKKCSYHPIPHASAHAGTSYQPQLTH